MLESHAFYSSEGQVVPLWVFFSWPRIWILAFEYLRFSVSHCWLYHTSLIGLFVYFVFRELIQRSGEKSKVSGLVAWE